LFVFLFDFLLVSLPPQRPPSVFVQSLCGSTDSSSRDPASLCDYVSAAFIAAYSAATVSPLCLQATLPGEVSQGCVGALHGRHRLPGSAEERAETMLHAQRKDLSRGHSAAALALAASQTAAAACRLHSGILQQLVSHACSSYTAYVEGLARLQAVTIAPCTHVLMHPSYFAQQLQHLALLARRYILRR
jgi:hypothetical protein